jgi:hypothetical protein
VRAWALVNFDGSIIRSSSSVTSVSHSLTGWYCVELDSSVVTAGATAPVMSPYYVGDDTSVGTPGTTTHIEYQGTCSPNGEQVLTYTIDNGTAVALTDDSFVIVVP